MDNLHVVLVDQNDHDLGIMEKMQAHKAGLLHRAFSVVIFNSKKEMLLQQRAADKYHSARLWTNACCSHPQKGEDIRASATRRLYFEMGLRCELTPAFQFTYFAQLDHDLIEHEYDHVFTGLTDEPPRPNPQEVQNYMWMSLELLQEKLNTEPENFTQWFHLLFEKMMETL